MLAALGAMEGYQLINNSGYEGFFCWRTSHISNFSDIAYTCQTNNATRTGPGTGPLNTAAILAVYLKSTCKNTPAAMDGSYNADSYTDLYLPNGAELDKLYQNQDFVEGFANSYCWSSS